MNVRPGTTRAANESLPINVASSLLEMKLRELHCRRMVRKSANLSGGRRASPWRVSNKMPRKVSTCDGPLILSSARGMPR